MSPNPQIPVFFLLLIGSSINLSGAAPNFLYTYCPTTNTTTLSSANRSIINSLLSNLSSSANLSSTPGFNYLNSTSSNSFQFHALYLCRGDLDSSTCRDCVAAASTDLPKNCPTGTQALIWYDECKVRYSNASFYGRVDVNFQLQLMNALNVTTNVTGFNQVLDTTLQKVSAEAAEDSSTNRLKFATEEAKYNEFQSVYTMGQCTPDLSSSGCSTCLQAGFNVISSGYKQGWRVLFFSCTLHYEIYKFYQTPAVAPAPAPNIINNSTNNTTTTTTTTTGNKSSSKVIIGVIVGAAAAVLLLIAAIVCVVKRRTDKKQADASEEAYFQARQDLSFDFSSVKPIEYDFGTLQNATKKFSVDNEIGQGGFGTVYKGELNDGRMIAVKKLVKRGQDLKSELVSLVKVQHRNLVKLLGYCSTIEENLLVYEFVPNHTLDHFLFDIDPTNQGLLNWPTRFEIINGISRGLLYLHQDSKPKIIHRDLKPTNILLDMNMDPKIGDFGLARIFGADQTHETTERVAGTKGYMAPEYVQYGKYSTRTDVYSFGVIVLEIVSGKKNTSFRDTGLAENLISYAREKWEQGNPMALLDSTLTDISSQSSDQVMNCIKIGLSCIQQEAEKRPPMSLIVHLLHESASNSLLILQQPYFYVTAQSNQARAVLELDLATNQQRVQCSVNEVTITELEPR